MLKPVEVAARLGVTRGTVYKILKTDPSFPKPIHVTPSSPRWRPADLDTWIEKKAAD